MRHDIEFCGVHQQVNDEYVKKQEEKAKAAAFNLSTGEAAPVVVDVIKGDFGVFVVRDFFWFSLGRARVGFDGKLWTFLFHQYISRGDALLFKHSGRATQ